MLRCGRAGGGMSVRAAARRAVPTAFLALGPRRTPRPRRMRSWKKLSFASACRPIVLSRNASVLSVVRRTSSRESKHVVCRRDHSLVSPEEHNANWLSQLVVRVGRFLGVLDLRRTAANVGVALPQVVVKHAGHDPQLARKPQKLRRYALLG